VPQAHVITQEEAASARFSIDDVVLPLPGARIRYPDHSTAEVWDSSRVWDSMGVSAWGSAHITMKLVRVDEELIPFANPSHGAQLPVPFCCDNHPQAHAPGTTAGAALELHLG
jgi:hypothetical protein